LPIYTDSTSSRLPALSGLADFEDALTRHDAQRLIELERENRLHRHLDGTALGDDLRGRASRGAGSCADRRTFTVTRDGADDRADGSPSAGVSRRPLVGA